MRTERVDRRVDRVASYLADRTGVSFAGTRGARLRATVQRALPAEPGQPSPETMDDELLSKLYEAVTVQESYFFREPTKLELIRKHVVPGMAVDGRRTKVWSAGCAAGEEVYTLAALLSRAGLAGRYDILGTDLSAAAVSAAQRGRYGRWSVRGLGQAELAQLFRDDEKRYVVRDELREGVRLEVHNLLDPPPNRWGRFDLVVCRNVLIYFTPEATRRAVAALTGALSPGGWLVLGASDPLADGMPGLETVVTEFGLAYRKLPGPPVQRGPAAASDVRVLAPASPADRPGRTERTSRPEVRRPVPAPRPDETLTVMLSGAAEALGLAQPELAEARARRAVERCPDEREAHRLLVQALAERRRLPAAVLAAERAVRLFPDDAEVRHLLAVVLLEAGDAERAAQAARQAVYLDAGLAPAHLVLGRAFELLGDTRRSRRSRRRGRRLLAGEDR